MNLEVYNVDTKSLIASLGVFSLVVGLAVQDTLKDFISGITIILENQFEVGDNVTISGFRGDVIYMGLKTTKIKSYEGEVFMIANRNITEVINHTVSNDLAIIDIPIAYEEDLDNLKDADIIFLTGGLPDQYLQRLEEFELIASLKESQAIFIGASAGAMVQLDTYHITPDNDYPKYQYGKGIGLVSGFEIEVHYCHSLAQDEGIQRVIAERHLPTYTIANDGGLLVSGQQRICFGHAKQVY